MQQVIIKRVDDFQGEGEATNYQFSLQGKAFEVDLNNENAKRLQDALGEFIAVARPVNQKARRTASKDLAEVRAWAESNGIPVSKRGRIAQTVLDGFREYKSALKNQGPTV